MQIHNLISKEFAPNLGVAYLHKYRTVMIGLIICSVTICWAKEIKNP